MNTLPLPTSSTPPIARPSLAGVGSAATETLFRKLVQDHRQRLYRFVVKHIGWGTDAEDITQQAFVEAAHSYATFKGESELSTWLYGIAMNLVRNYLSRPPPPLCLRRRRGPRGDGLASP